MKIKCVVFMVLIGFLSNLKIFSLPAPSKKASIFLSASAKAPENRDWNFELKNRTGQKLYVTLQQGDELIFFRQELAASKGFFTTTYGYLRFSGLNLDLPIFIILEAGKPGGKADGYVMYAGSQDKTVFVSYENGKLRSQVGKKLKTESGLSLSNNITNEEIVQLTADEVQKQLEGIRSNVVEANARIKFAELERERLEQEAQERAERLKRIVGEHGIPKSSAIESLNEPIAPIKPSKKEKKKPITVEEPIVSKKPKQPKQNTAELILRGKEAEISPEELIEEPAQKNTAQEMRENIYNEIYAERVAKLPPNLKKFYEEIPTASIQDLQARLQTLQMMRQYLSAEDKASVDLVINAIKGRLSIGR